MQVHEAGSVPAVQLLDPADRAVRAHRLSPAAAAPVRGGHVPGTPGAAAVPLLLPQESAAGRTQPLGLRLPGAVCWCPGQCRQHHSSAELLQEQQTWVAGDIW